jgi:hypothetical protein
LGIAAAGAAGSERNWRPFLNRRPDAGAHLHEDTFGQVILQIAAPKVELRHLVDQTPFVLNPFGECMRARSTHAEATLKAGKSRRRKTRQGVTLKRWWRNGGVRIARLSQPVFAIQERASTQRNPGLGHHASRSSAAAGNLVSRRCSPDLMTKKQQNH